MCGRYTLYKTSKLPKRFKTAAPAFELRDSYNVAPGQLLPIVTLHGQNRQLEIMKWGLVPSWAKDPSIGYRMINARSEGIFDKPSWRGPIRRHRCLVPATGFYEWKRIGGQKIKQPFLIALKDQELFSFAGLFDSWHDAHGNELWTYAIITTTPNKEMAEIHDRMPVILQAEHEDLWLDPATNQGVLEDLMRPYADGMLTMFEVSTDVNVVRNNDSHLVYPLNSR